MEATHPFRVSLAATLERELIHAALELDACHARLLGRCDRDSIHALRVTSRRTRALLWSMKPWIRRNPYRLVDSRLQHLARWVAPLRDMDVVATFIPARIGPKAGLGARKVQRLRLALRRSRARIRREVLAEIHSAAFRQAVQEIHDQLSAGRKLIRKSVPDGNQHWRARILKGLARFNQQVLRAKRRDLHPIRLHAKRCRYALEALDEPALRRPLRRLKAIQDALGHYCDARLAAAWLKSPRSVDPASLRRRLLQATQYEKVRSAAIALKALREQT